MAEDQNRTLNDKFMLRFPEGMRDQVRHAAEFSGRSMNAEIIQRLKFTFDVHEFDKLRLDLPGDLWNSLMTDAGVLGVSTEDRAIQLLQDAFDADPDRKAALDKVRSLANQNSELSELIAHMKEKEDADFLLYYTKVVQLAQFVSAVMSASEVLPQHLLKAGGHLEELAAAELATLRARQEEALFKQRLLEHSRKLRQEEGEE